MRGHRALTTLGKSLVLEEFGLARDWETHQGIYGPDLTTQYRDFSYTAMFEEVYGSMSTGRPAGDNLWAWGRQARPGAGRVGAPSHEIPGWYSVYDTDDSSLAIISAHAEEMARG